MIKTMYIRCLRIMTWIMKTGHIDLRFVIITTEVASDSWVVNGAPG